MCSSSVTDRLRFGSVHPSLGCVTRNRPALWFRQMQCPQPETKIGQSLGSQKLKLPSVECRGGDYKTLKSIQATVGRDGQVSALVIPQLNCMMNIRFLCSVVAQLKIYYSRCDHARFRSHHRINAMGGLPLAVGQIAGGLRSRPLDWCAAVQALS